MIAHHWPQTMKFAMYKYSYEHSSTINKILYYFTWPIYQTTFKYIKTVHNICAPRTPAKFFNFEVPDILRTNNMIYIKIYTYHTTV